VVVGSTKGWVIALEGASGKELWRTRVNSELLSAPAISEKVVVMRSVDGDCMASMPITARSCGRWNSRCRA